MKVSEVEEPNPNLFYCLKELCPHVFRCCLKGWGF